MPDRPSLLTRPRLAHWQQRFRARSLRDDSAMSAVEFAIIAPVLLLMAVGVVDYGEAAFRSMQVQNAAQAGIQYAAVHGYQVSGITAAVQSTGAPGISVSSGPTQFCGCPTTTNSVPTLTSTPCGSDCADGTVSGTYVTLTAAATYTTLISYPLIPTSFAFSSQATVRIQ